MARNQANSGIVTACTQRVSAIKKHLGAKDVLYVGRKEMKAADLAQVFQEALDTRATAVTKRGEYKTALEERATAEATRVAADVALEPYIVQRFGVNSPEAHDFGYGPKVVAEKSAVTKAKAVLLGQATRVARGTTSRKQKLRIKGTLAPEVVAALDAIGVVVKSVGPAPTANPVAAPAAAPPAAAPVVAPAVNTAANGTAHN
jgi:hypothetical protein